jgi:hypothetical protein
MAQDFPARRHCRHAFSHCCGSLCLIGCDDYCRMSSLLIITLWMLTGLQVHETQKNARCAGINYLAHDYILSSLLCCREKPRSYDDGFVTITI